MKQQIDAVFVTYRPDIVVFRRALDSICGQVGTVYVVDNSADAMTAQSLRQIQAASSNVVLSILDENSGIAHAQNVGMRQAIAGGATLTLLSDQDTYYPVDYVQRMLANYVALDQPQSVAALAPDFQDSNKGNGETDGFFVLDGVKSVKQAASANCIDIAQAIASGLIINNAALARIGMMDDALFIDWVDFEWCWRARSMGYRIIGCHNVVIQHTLGDSVARVAGKRYSLHTPLRNYYIVRNGVAIALTKKYLGRRMRLGIFLKSIRYMIGFSIVGDQHVKNAIYCGTGFYHGIRGRLGPFDNKVAATA